MMLDKALRDNPLAILGLFALLVLIIAAVTQLARKTEESSYYPYGTGFVYTGRACWFRDSWGQMDLGREVIDRLGRRRCRHSQPQARVPRGITYKVGTIPTFPLPLPNLPIGGTV